MLHGSEVSTLLINFQQHSVCSCHSRAPRTTRDVNLLLRRAICRIWRCPHGQAFSNGRQEPSPDQSLLRQPQPLRQLTSGCLRPAAHNAGPATSPRLTAAGPPRRRGAQLDPSGCPAPPPGPAPAPRRA